MISMLIELNWVELLESWRAFLLFGVILASIGLYGLVLKKNILGIVISAQILLVALALILQGIGIKVNQPVEAQVFILVLIIVAIVFQSIFLSVAIRMFQSKDNIELASLKEMKH